MNIRSTINQLLDVPSTDPDDARRRKLLNIMLFGTAVVGLLGLLTTVVLSIVGFGEPGRYPSLYLGSLATLIGVSIIYAINRYHSGQVASSLFLLLMMGVFAFVDEPQEVANGRSLVAFAIPIFVASVLLRPYASFIAAGLNSLVITAIALSIGMIPNPFAMLLFFSLALASWLSARALESTLGDARSRAERLALVNRIAKTASATLHLDDLMEMVYQEIVPVFQADAFFIALYDEETNELDFRIQVDEDLHETPGKRPLKEGLTSHVISEKKPLIVRNFKAEQKHLPPVRSFGTMKAPASWLGVPLLIGERVIGVINVQAYHPYAWDEEDEQLLFTIADQIAVTIENVGLYETVQLELTERKRAEKNLRLLNLELDQRVQERTQELAESLSRNQAILEGIADGVIVFDTGGKAIVANPAITDLIGWPIRKVIGCDIQTLMGDDVSDDDQEIIVGVLRNKEMYYPSIKLEWGDKTLSVSIAPVHMAPGKPIGSVAVFRDFTREAEISRMKSAFVSTASHELRTPLGAILGYTDMLQEGVYGPLSEKQSNTLERIIANTGRLLSLVNNLLDQAQIEAGTLKLDVTPFILADLINDTMGVMDVLAQAKRIKLTTHVADDLPATLFGDRQRLYQILINLVSNSIKFTDEGTVRLDARQLDADHWALEVSDTGSGIPPDARDRIFEPFRHADDSYTRENAGAGLGLSIVKQLVEMMNGEITLESEVGHGSTFTITLPMVPVT